MGKTLWGIDLDESPAGGLIKRLLSDEELEALTDGGRADGGDGDDRAGGSDTGAGAGAGDDAEESGFEFDVETGDDDVNRDDEDLDVEVERDDDGGFDVDVETDDEDVAVDVDVDDGEVEVDIGHRGASMFDPDVDADADEGGSLRDRFPSLGGDDAADDVADDADEDDADEDDADEDGGGLVARIRPHLLKIAVAGVVLAVVAVLAWRYLGTVKSVAGDKLGRGGGEEEFEDVTEVSVDVDDDAPAARRRAKGLDEDDSLDDGSFEGDSVGDEDDTAAADAVGDEDEEEVAGSTGSGNSDTGALLGLAFLALVAALVRKLTEEREHDPLVDGPE